jgi:phenylacetate-CoA ligase
MTTNQFINPVFLLRIAKSYLSDLERIQHINDKQLKQYQDKALKRMVKYAYTIPLYYEKYKEAGIHPNDIKGIDDIGKLPFITKDDLRENYPDRIIPKGFDKEHNFLLSTSGSTGKPVFIYVDAFSTIKSLIAFVRSLKTYGGNWQKTKIMMVIDNAPGSLEHTVFGQSTLPFLSKFMSLKNLKYIDITEKPETIIKEMDEFQPKFLGSDPNMLRKLAFLKNNGYGKSIKLSCIVSGGAMLDSYTRTYVENSFNAKILDIYGTTEAGPLAFQCSKEKYYHVHSYFVYLEFLDDKNKPVPPDTPGHLVVTKLYGKGTPIIRYRGIEDLVTPTTKKTCCTISSQIIKQIEGRSTDLIILPNKKLLSPLTVTGIPAKIMDEFKTYKIKQFQIIQQKIDEIEILIVIDEKLRNKGPSVERILEELKKRFSEKIGHGINIVVHEVDEIQKDERLDHVKVVISKVKHKVD